MNNGYVLQTAALRLTCLEAGGKITGFELAVREGNNWASMAKTQPLSHLIYQDKQNQRHEADLVATSGTVTAQSLHLTGDFTDVDGVKWTLSVTFSLTDSPHRIAADYRLEANEARKAYRWIGPSLQAGEGSFGTKKDKALFPGLEFLLGDEPSSDTRFAAPKYANRAVPHAYRITVPMMAVSHAGQAVGLIWDPNQDWGRAWRHPAALFSSPNRLQPNAANHWMALFAPSVEPRWLNEGETEAHQPVGIDASNAATLSAQLVGIPGDVIDVLREWVRAYGLPALPDPGHDYRANVDLCIESYLNVAWDDARQGWHHTLADPWGPRFESILANQLWRYSRWSEGNPVWRARARDQVQRTLLHMRETLPAPHNVPPLELALVYGQIDKALESAAAAAREAMESQQENGSWGWTPDAVANIADFKTEDRLKTMGTEKDSATGFTSGKVRPVMKYALATGDPKAVASLRKATDWCNAQARPEGAQTWELHLHVPDVLAAPYLIDINLAVYELTGDAHYLDKAEWWAWNGLPFTFLWNGYYRPVMRYGTVPVFGVTFHDVQSWFGVIVQWNGLWYADSLFRLARHRRADGPIDWLHLAEGISRHGMQEQIQEGPYKGFYPDAFNTVRGDEEYTWWLNPQLIGLNTLPQAGLPVNADPIVLRSGDGTPIHITSGATVADSRLSQGSLHLLLKDFAGETSYTLIGTSKRPAKIICEGLPLAEVDDLDGATTGWMWLETHHTAVIKTIYPKGAVSLYCQF